MLPGWFVLVNWVIFLEKAVSSRWSSMPTNFGTPDWDLSVASQHMATLQNAKNLIQQNHELITRNEHIQSSNTWSVHSSETVTILSSSISLNQSHFPTSSVSPAPGTTKEASENFKSIPYMALCCPGPRRPLPRCRTKVTKLFSPQQLQGLCRVTCTFTKGRLAVRL